MSSVLIQLPKTLLTMKGVWMAKKKAKIWKTMFLAAALFSIPLLVMGFAVQRGADGVFLTGSIVTVVGVMVVLAKVLPMLEEKA